MKYKDIITKIQETLEKCDKIATIYSYPLGRGERAKSYPAVIYYPDTITNDFSDSGSNAKDFTFKLWVIVSTNNLKQKEIFNTILPDAVDDVLAELDKDWNFGTTINGHRVWSKVTSGAWGLTQEERALDAWAELTLSIRFSNNI